MPYAVLADNQTSEEALYSFIAKESLKNKEMNELDINHKRYKYGSATPATQFTAAVSIKYLDLPDGMQLLGREHQGFDLSTQD